MNPHSERKKGRNQTQERTYQKIHSGIVKILLKTSPRKGTTRQDLMNKAGIKSRRILRKHLDDLKKKDLLGEENRLLFWNPNRRIMKVWESMIDKLTERLVTLGIDPDKFFSETIIATVPKNTDKGLVYEEAFISRDVWEEFLDFIANHSKTILSSQEKERIDQLYFSKARADVKTKKP